MHPLRFPNSGIRAKGQQSPAGTTGCSQPIGAATARRHSLLQHGARKGGWLQGACKELPPVIIPSASRDGLPLARQVPAGKGSRRLCKGNDGDSGVEGKEGLGHPLVKRMILPL
ncbi:hypothetical protein B296_00031780 [Ensete ventricosum]|uniref:Uncharacterized protein n=1 Tax=Ensete ventricosum TaxID=4639 RepID=A0A426XMV7_ENSVE|nr:hypothetical protein B296_00031780 [Ensete ventricosum]